MEVPLRISFKNLDHSDAVEARVRERVEGLEKVYGRLTRCEVTVEAPERRRRKGNLYQVKIMLGIPGKDVVVNRHPGQRHAHEDVLVAVRDAFDAARRQLEDHARLVSGRVKTHEAPDHGSVVRLFPYEGYGFVALADGGGEVYFHRNSVVGDGFDALEVGSEVRIVLAEGESEHGPQASTVQPTGKHHIVE